MLVYFRKAKGFTLIELLIVLGIIVILMTAVTLIVLPLRSKANDARRKSDIAQAGKVLILRCYIPDAGAGDYDLVPLVDELLAKYPNSAFTLRAPRDPARGTETEAFYRYVVNSSTKKCAVYGNLEQAHEPTTLSVTVPTPGGGTGIFEAATPGWNGTTKYFQFSN